MFSIDLHYDHRVSFKKKNNYNVEPYDFVEFKSQRSFGAQERPVTISYRNRWL